MTWPAAKGTQALEPDGCTSTLQLRTRSPSSNASCSITRSIYRADTKHDSERSPASDARAPVRHPPIYPTWVACGSFSVSDVSLPDVLATAAP